MKLVVLDASVSIKWYIMEDDSELAQKLLDSELLFLAPDLFSLRLLVL
jgi:predicted nucleic acid-binding protein